MISPSSRARSPSSSCWVVLSTACHIMMPQDDLRLEGMCVPDTRDSIFLISYVALIAGHSSHSAAIPDPCSQ